MKRRVGRASAVAVLAALCASPALFWATVLHAAVDDHHAVASLPRAADLGALASVLHGHAHDDGTPPHDHTSLTSHSSAALRTRALAQAAVTLASAPLIPVTPLAAGLRLAFSRGCTHDPPPRAGTALVLRI